MDKGEVKIIFERKANRVISKQLIIKGNEFNILEIVGLLQICSYELTRDAAKRAESMSKIKKPVKAVKQ